MHVKMIQGAGLTATMVFWVSLFVFAAIHPDYTHSHKAISELGAFGAPHAFAWNVIGFITPGILLAICGGGVALLIDGRKALLFWLLVISGLGFSGTGVIPTEMIDGSPAMDSVWTGGHIIMTLASGLPWLIASVLIVWRVRHNSHWQHLTVICSVLGLCAFASFTLNVIAGVIPFLNDNPGLGQRISFAFYFAWFLIVGRLFTRQATTNAAGGH